MGSSRRWGIRALAVLAVTSVTVFALASAAGAKTVRVYTGDKDTLAQTCRDAGGSTTANKDYTSCDFPNGTTTTCTTNAKDNCVAVSPREKLQSLLSDIRAVGGRDVKTVSDDSKVWVQTAPPMSTASVPCKRCAAVSTARSSRAPTASTGAARLRPSPWSARTRRPRTRARVSPTRRNTPLPASRFRRSSRRVQRRLRADQPRRQGRPRRQGQPRRRARPLQPVFDTEHSGDWAGNLAWRPSVGQSCERAKGGSQVGWCQRDK